ncbi:hypothetical protein [Candidatus Halobonum tyrrellensis]|nr:hypothetical protein [Candidatus Halobonum tyrrellensis]
MGILTGAFIALLLGPLVAYWGARALERATGRKIIPSLDWDEE